MVKITDEETQLLVKFYKDMKETGNWMIFGYDRISRDEMRVLESLCSRNLILKTKSGRLYMSVNAILILSSYGVATEIIDNLNEFLDNHNRKIHWSGQELEEYALSKNLKSSELAFSINFGKAINFFKIFDEVGSPLPYKLSITLKGEEFAKNPEAFVSYIEFNKELFSIEFNDCIILEWLKKSSKGTEDYNIEFKEKVHYNDIRESVSAFANHESGILGIGFDDEGKLINLENLDEERRRLFDAIKDFQNLKLESKIVEDENGKAGIIVMVPKTQEPLFLGDNVLARYGTSNKNLSKKEILDLVKQKNVTQCGHLWLKSLRFYKYSKHIEDK